ncbi:MAG: thiamine pyrophosphate-binding protein [Halobacteriales archaeon]|nr:thiamine pyrophosphate-binding protein [Halobacteriales archaeon]
MSDEKTGADLFVETLDEYGVERLFGNPGTTELPITEAVADGDVEYVLSLHEDAAVGAAAGYASTSRHLGEVRPGVVNLHVVPGLSHGLGNVYNAMRSGVPLVVTAGIHETDFQQEDPVLSGGLVETAEPHVKYAVEAKDVDAVPAVLRRAFREALTPPTGPVFVALPLDVMTDETEETPDRLGGIPDGGDGDPEAVEEAVDALAEADEPVLVLGDGVARSQGVQEAVELAEASGARVHAEVLASEGNFPTDHDQFVSFLPVEDGLISTFLQTDTIVFVGCSTNTTLWKNEVPLVPDDATIVQVGDSGRELGKNAPADTAVLGDPARVCGRIAEGIAEKLDDETRDERLENVRSSKQALEPMMRQMGEDEADSPRSSKAELVDAMVDEMGDAYVVDEGVTSKYALLTRFPFEEAQYLGNKGGGLGYGMPASVGAALAHEDLGVDRQVVGFIGDGSYFYYPQTVYTAVREKLNMAFVVPNNDGYTILRNNADQILGKEGREYVGTEFEPRTNVVNSAKAYGAKATRVETPDGLNDALSEAKEEGVHVVDVAIHD